MSVEERDGTIGTKSGVELAFVHCPVVPSTQQHQVIQTGGAAVGPMVDVMGIAPSRRAAREATAAIAGVQRTPNGWRDRPGATAGLGHLAVSVVMHHHERRVARQPSRRFPGNSLRSMVEFEHAAFRCRGVLFRALGPSRRWHRRRVVHVQHHLIAVARRSAIQVR
jgi:hypothetical protein